MAPTNVVMLTVDSLRADAIGTHTPEIDGIAADGTTFENAFAHGNWTPFSFPAILGSRPVFADEGDIGLPRTPVLAEVLRDAGVATAGFNAANGFLTTHWGYDRGFEEFESFVGGDSAWYRRHLAAHPTIQGWLELAGSPFRRAASRLRHGDDGVPFTDTSRMLDVERRAGEFIERRAADDRPFFLWVHYMDAHTPYVPAPRHLREVSSDRLGTFRMLRAHARTGLGREVNERTLDDLRTLYDGTVRQLDASIGRLRERLAEADLADETSLIVVGDHGEEFQDHGHLAHYPKLYDELVHVPLIVSHPEGSRRTESAHVGLDSIPPTVAAFMGASPAVEWEGRSLERTVVVGIPPDQDPIVSVAVRGERITQQPIPRRLDDGTLLVSVRTTDWTTILNTETGEQEVYDRRTDPGERRDLSENPMLDPAVGTRFDRIATAHADRLAHGSGSVETPPEVTVQLEALGYR